MKWLALLGVIVVMGAAVLFLRSGPAPPVQRDPVTAQPAVPRPMAAARQAIRPAAPTASSAGSWRRIELHGVLFQQHDPAASQALLSYDGQRAQVFRGGEPVADGWTVRSIQADHVTVAKGAEQHRLDVVQTRPRAGASPPASAAASAMPAASLPGFIPAPPGREIRRPESLESNRRFLQDRRNQAAGAAPQLPR